MRSKFVPMNDGLYRYLVEHGHNRDPLLAELAAETERLGDIARMLISPEQGTFLSILVRAIGARSAIEIGTFTGYSALCLARGLVPGGRLLCCDVNEEWAGIARRYFARAGLADRIDLRLAPASETLAALPADATFDFAFVDADKGGYVDYYEALLPRLRTDGLIVFDNVLWSGRVADPDDDGADTLALRRLNDLLAGDPRVEAVLLPVADGLTLARKR